MNVPVSEAQADMRKGYCSGGAGILASSIAWSAAAIVVFVSSAQHAVWVLLIGGVLIHPVSVILCKGLGASGAHSKGNPLGQLAGASTFWLVFCIPIAYLLSLQQARWFFPAMLLIIGGRYLVFATLYGMRLYWVLGLSLAGTGFCIGCLAAPMQTGAVMGALLEAGFAGVVLFQHRRWLQVVRAANV